jgi:hypothetical protein
VVRIHDRPLPAKVRSTSSGYLYESRSGCRKRILALLVFAGYTVFVIVFSIFWRDGDTPLHWTTIILLAILAVAAAIGTRRLFKRSRAES